MGHSQAADEGIGLQMWREGNRIYLISSCMLLTRDISYSEWSETGRCFVVLLFGCADDVNLLGKNIDIIKTEHRSSIRHCEGGWSRSVCRENYVYVHVSSLECRTIP
jgi:hypothetical protein